MLINVKMPTNVGILTYEHDEFRAQLNMEKVYNVGPGHFSQLIYQVFLNGSKIHSPFPTMIK